MEKLDAVLFDMAGTTVQATDQVPAAFKEAFERVGIALSDQQIQAVRGQSKQEAISALLVELAGNPEAERLTGRVYDDFHKTLIKHYESSGVEAIDGAEQTITWLKQRDVKVALSTGFDRSLVDLLLGHVGWQDLIDTVVCSQDVSRGRPAPYLIFRAMERMDVVSVRRIAVVGDTVSDLEAAWNAGVERSVGVLSGAHTETQLRAYPHWAIIDSVQELPALLD